MSVVYRCPNCGGVHRSRLHASRSSFFQEVVSQLADVLEQCPSTGDWSSLTFADMTWKSDIDRLAADAQG